MNIFAKFFNGLKKTKNMIAEKLSRIFHGELDADFYEELEYVLISSDIGAQATEEIIENIKKVAKKQKIRTEEDLKKALRDVMIELIDIDNTPQKFPVVITMVGVNGVGKTTTIGKLAYNFKSDKKSVLLVAGDTFRAAASDQLNEWAKRVGVRIVKYNEGADPGAVVFDGISSGKAKGDDVILVDTAGRLHNKDNLMEELKKINRVIDREWTGNKQTYLVIDATTGQNAITQVKAFNEFVHIDGIVLTKLDGSAKGGIVFAIAKELGVPVKYVGLGEGKEDLQPFDARAFVENII